MAAATADQPYDEEMVHDLIFLAAYGERLLEVVAPENNLPAGSDLTAVTKHGAEKLGIPEEDFTRLERILANLARMQASLRTQGIQVIDLCAKQVEAYARAKNAQDVLNAWNTVKDRVQVAIRSIGQDHPFSILKKSEKLYYSHQGLLSEARIITDLRPVFDGSGEKILRLMVTHSLLLEYYEGGSQKRLELGVDLNDVRLLQRACERAQVKAVTLKEAMAGQSWPTTLGLDSPEADQGETQ